MYHFHNSVRLQETIQEMYLDTMWLIKNINMIKHFVVTYQTFKNSRICLSDEDQNRSSNQNLEFECFHIFLVDAGYRSIPYSVSMLINCFCTVLE